MTGNKSRNKHHNIALSFSTLARAVARLRTSLYQPFAGPSTEPSDGPLSQDAGRADSGRRTPSRPLAKIILFPGAIRPSTTGRRIPTAADNLLVNTDAWYSRAVAKSMPHRPFPGTYA